MSYYYYAPYNGIKAPMGSRPVTTAKCLEFYKKHTFNTILLRRIKTLYLDDFSKSQAIETEISIGDRKCEYWYKRGDFSGATLAKEVSQIKRAVEALDISVFKD